MTVNESQERYDHMVSILNLPVSGFPIWRSGGSAAYSSYTLLQPCVQNFFLVNFWIWAFKMLWKWMRTNVSLWINWSPLGTTAPQYDHTHLFVVTWPPLLLLLLRSPQQEECRLSPVWSCWRPAAAPLGSGTAGLDWPPAAGGRCAAAAVGPSGRRSPRARLLRLSVKHQCV